MACCPGPCSTQIVFPDTITFLGTALGEQGLSRLTIGTAVYTIYSSDGSTTNSIGYGGGCDTVCCCPCSVSFTATLEVINTSGQVGGRFSGTFTVKFESNCAIVEHKIQSAAIN